MQIFIFKLNEIERRLTWLLLLVGSPRPLLCSSALIWKRRSNTCLSSPLVTSSVSELFVVFLRIGQNVKCHYVIMVRQNKLPVVLNPCQFNVTTTRNVLLTLGWVVPTVSFSQYDSRSRCVRWRLVVPPSLAGVAFAIPSNWNLLKWARKNIDF